MNNQLKRRAALLTIELEALKQPNDSVENVLNLLSVCLNDAEEISKEIMRMPANPDEEKETA